MLLNDTINLMKSLLKKDLQEAIILLKNKNINDFYKDRNKYEMGEKRKAKLTDKEGRTSIVYFSEKKPTDNEMDRMIGDHSMREFYESVLFANPTIETNIFYSQESNGDVFHESDLLISKENKGHMETTEKHRKHLVIKNGELLPPPHFMPQGEEFIGKAK